MLDTHSGPENISRQELFALHEHYESVVKDMLGFCYQYLNFYVGLLSAILAATLTGLLTIKSGDLRGLILFLGPLLTLAFVRIGYLNITVFYRRYVEAWVATVNIEAMLDLRYTVPLAIGKKRPAFMSQQGGFLPVIERTPIKDALEKATSEQWSAEQVVLEITKIGDTLAYARNTFIIFGIASGLLLIVIAWIALA
jgi:hypothetical protein